MVKADKYLPILQKSNEITHGMLSLFPTVGQEHDLHAKERRGELPSPQSRECWLLEWHNADPFLATIEPGKQIPDFSFASTAKRAMAI